MRCTGRRAALAGAALMLALTSARAEDAMAKAAEIVQGRCFLCHGVQGESSSPVFPRLAGQHGQYVAQQLADYKSGKRVNETMKQMAEELSPEEMKALGSYFQGQKPQPHPVSDAELAQVGRYIFLRGNSYSGVPACASCHGEQGHGTDRLPRIAGQHAQYTEKQLKAFNQRQRTNDNAVMQTVAAKLTELELKAVSAYLSGMP